MATRSERSHPNHLSGEVSPYLLQHAHNPVDWRPWSDDAFVEARRRDVPVFLSIGYSTCHWCHVMARECFEDPAIAGLMNRLFVCVKVDREERPDVDEAYMTATQVMSGHGGWPMSVFLEPAERRPFWCGTYFPPRRSEHAAGMPSFPEVLEGVSRLWRERRGDVLEQAGVLADAVALHLARRRGPVRVGVEDAERALRHVLGVLDRVHGGLGRAPKFPQPIMVEFLLDMRRLGRDEETRAAAARAARLTLDRMSVGGLMDQVGGGFHRYCVDATWTVPHFEKMLCDNALLAGVYARSAAETPDEHDARIARLTLDYVLREMTSAEGAFLSAQDADAAGREGLTYVWTPTQVRAALPPGDAELAIRLFGIDQGPNFRDPHHPGEAASVLRLDDRPERLAPRLAMAPDDLTRRLGMICAVLLQERRRRPQPGTDGKVIAAWNGLMVGAMARCGRLLDKPGYVDAAARAARFVLHALRAADGRLARTWRAGATSAPAQLEDYAFLASGLLELRRAQPGDDAWLAEARRLVHEACELFADGEGGFYDTRPGEGELFVRARSTHDGPTPSAVSAMLGALIDLHEAEPAAGWLDRAVSCVRSVSADVSESPAATLGLVRALVRLLLIPGAQSVLDALPAPDHADEPSDFTPVEILAPVERVRVAPDRPAEVPLLLRIARGYHLPAADPGPRGGDLVPFRLGVTGGEGCSVYCDYPPGERLEGDDGVLVYRGDIQMNAVIEAAPGASGRPIITASFQPCSDTACLRPVTVELDVAIDLAPSVR